MPGKLTTIKIGILKGYLTGYHRSIIGSTRRMSPREDKLALDSGCLLIQSSLRGQRGVSRLSGVRECVSLTLPVECFRNTAENPQLELVRLFSCK